jgi:predicted glycoside hydrolase/deacetylase ChbG (UPF0249 family)
MLNIKYHIDDFGLTKSITLKLLNLITQRLNFINGVSIIVNTNKKVELWAKKLIEIDNNISLYLHLNLIDGKPLLKKAKKIVNDKGFFKHGFVGLFLLSFSPKFLEYKKEIKNEVELQIILYLKIIKNIKYKKYNQISLDSHQYVHMLPWVSDLIFELSKKYNIVFIRSTSEPFILSKISNFFKIWFYKNLLKFFILKLLNFFNNKKIKKNKKKTNKYFFGIINSGHMDKNYINIITKQKKINYQILFHPNIAKKNEKIIFGNNKKIEYYLNDDRVKEFNFILKN